MNYLKDDEIKKIAIGIMDAIHSFSKDNHIEYCLAYGSLIGAVRHQGFIPWDDDMDIVMPRESYERFLKSFNKENSRYRVINSENTEGYPYAFAKVIDTFTEIEEYRFKKYDGGIFIDIFPLDNIGSDLNLILKQGKKVSIYNKMLQLKMGRMSYYHGLKKAGLVAAKIVLFPFKRKYLIRKINVEAQRISTDSGTYIADMVEYESYREREIMKKEWFSSYQEAEFEGRKYYIPEKYDEILTKLYGDYMELPPADKQITHHSFDAWYR